ncbi:MAG: hypothetical protein AABY22_31720 [Nanoarchaeota archaeon]|mgnify:CR=1 FL=1
MTQLKTLKDFGEKGQQYKHYIDEELKEEAIKWIKDLQDYSVEGKFSCIETPEQLKPFYEHVRGNPLLSKTLIGWIKHFFNITEEGLRNKKKEMEIVR